MSPAAPLVDAFGRVHTYLRVSVTDRCNLRCVYCMPAEGYAVAPREDLLSYEELTRLVRTFVGLGVRRVRLTGGEPTVRRDFVSLVQALGAIEGLDDLALTTNGLRLALLAPLLKQAGLRRVNVSIDALDAPTFARLSRGGDVRRVLDGIQAAREAGLTPVKLNAVILAGENEHAVDELVDWARQWPQDLVVRFIEYMPFEARWHQCVPARELRARLSRRLHLEPALERLGDGPAVYVRLEDGLRVGFISPLSEKFCATCNRLRLMANGHLRTCLSDDGTPNLRDALRAGEPAEALAARIRRMVMGKREGHGCTEEGGQAFEGVMTRVGG